GGIPALSRTNDFMVNVLESNLAPVLAAVTNRFIHAGETLVVTNAATDEDWPADVLSFQLTTNAPVDAVIDSLSGVLEWTAPFSENFVTNTFGIVVTDDGQPALSDEKNFQVVVVPPLRATAQFSSDGEEIV